MEIRLILGDQLNAQHSWFKEVNPQVTYVMMEMRQETDYVVHHIQKVVAFFSAMRQFAKALTQEGHQVVYYAIDHPQNKQHLTQNLDALIEANQATSFAYQAPDEYRLDQQLANYCKTLQIPTQSADTEHFLTERLELQSFFEGKKQYIMEFFYRYMRKKFNLLMQGSQPEGDQWNFDKNNRNKWKGSPAIPDAFQNHSSEVQQIFEAVNKAGIETLGHFDLEKFNYPSNRSQALQQLQYFCENLLVHFGDYQDAMHTEETDLFHSRVSFALNVKILHPLEVMEAVISYYRANSDSIQLSQVEGFVRQILGWREYMRGIYWKEMPAYQQKNKLQNSNPLPDFYWTGNTQMNCLKHAVNNSLDTAYAHHIQRLMITGNFALLAQIDPTEVDRWYLGIYADAIEWVQLPNTRGMSQWADGGIVATKPYVSAASYISKMSNYCDSCSYDKKKRVGDNACPFNSLYWNFLDDKKEYFSKNNRMAMMLRLVEKIPAEEMFAIKERASQILSQPDAF